MAFLNREFPGSGVTVWNVERLQAHWWAYWVRVCRQFLEKSKAES